MWRGWEAELGLGVKVPFLEWGTMDYQVGIMCGIAGAAIQGKAGQSDSFFGGEGGEREALLGIL